MDRLTCMQTFIRVVESGSISAAAEVLNQSSQLTGKQLRTLEQNLGIKLISRTTRTQSLTDSGLLFYERAKIILAEMEEAETLISETRAIPVAILGSARQSPLAANCLPRSCRNISNKTRSFTRIMFVEPDC
jgi:DNA-binding transcriptional LysR family regulator